MKATPKALKEQIRVHQQPSAAHPPGIGISPSNEQKISVPIKKPNKPLKATPKAVREKISLVLSIKSGCSVVH
ncbi:MAG: hypothetical protein JNM68_13890 [Dinghuibacter sp.]|nr:hypothetical protein [Dinghuibacter sp.]